MFSVISAVEKQTTLTKLGKFYFVEKLKTFSFVAWNWKYVDIPQIITIAKKAVESQVHFNFLTDMAW